MSLIDLCIITTNVLVFLASVALAIVTAADVVKDGNRTVRDALKALVKVSLSKVGTDPSGNVSDEQLETVAKQIEDELEHRHNQHEQPEQQA